jgi:general secretion pathway protein K
MGVVRAGKRTSEAGSATIVALIVVSLVAIFITSLAWQQNFAIRKLNIYKDNTQIQWLQRSVNDLVRLVLKIDVQNDPNVDHLGEFWAIRLDNNKVKDYIKTEDLPEELKNVQFSAFIIDAQGLFNIANLWDSNKVTINLPAVQAYGNLLQMIGFDRNLAERTAKQVLVSNLKPQFLDDLVNIPGYNPQMINKLSQYAILLPEPTTININTTSIEVFMANYPSFSLADAQAVMQARLKTPLKNQDDITQLLGRIRPNQVTSSSANIDVKSQYWLANTAIVIDQRNISTVSLIKRNSTPLANANFTTILWSKQKISQLR